jgi:5,10-methylenetetrahydromethanopterin reductase
MEFGIALPSTVDAWRTVQRAEALGFSHAWFYDTQLLSADVFVTMALAAEHTTRIRLGTGVVVPSNRIAPVTANAMAALNHLAPGRIDFGVGTGFTARKTMGLGPMRIDDLRAYVQVVQALWRGETTEATFEGKRRKIRFLDPEAATLNITDPIPVHVSAFAHKARALTAEIADGWINFMTILPLAVHDAGSMAAACRAAGRDPATLYTTVFALGCVLREGEDASSARAMAQAGPLVPVMFHGLMDGMLNPDLLPPPLAAAVTEFRAQYESYTPPDAPYLQLHTGHLLYVRPEERRFVTPDLIEAATLTGSPALLRDHIAQLREAGYRQLAIQLVPTETSALDDWADLIATL